MSGENTENPQNPGEDATTDAPVSGGEPPVPPAPSAPSSASGVEPFAVPAPETVAIPDAEAAIENFEVPPPPTFGAVPPPPGAEPVIPDPVIPPAPSENAAADATDAPALRKRTPWAPDDTWTSASAHKQEVVPPTAAQKAESRAAASRAATARDEASRNYVSPAAGGTEGNSYRGWTVAIFAGLTILLIGAIVLIAYLANNAPLALPSPEETTVASSQDESEAVDTTTVTAPTLTTEAPTAAAGCAAVCTDVTALVGDEVVGQDGVIWTLAGQWTTADPASLPAAETVVGHYASIAGDLTFTIWAFDDDVAADDAFATLSAERGSPDHSDSVYDNGSGIRDSFLTDASETVLWSVTGDEGRPWVMEVAGPNADGAVFDFYLALPI
ncbi:hypothetical protein [Microbacterium murale]|uniref:Uncharacterized protein n=1 Tax=Microbacterium murale TaxID=1081040 RepID=A0ABU0P743_9MICO|nr:hypothetical protein [Microbacterium murale]MDQ0643154.1 hypothetical protein [Microbacterium murale]